MPSHNQVTMRAVALLLLHKTAPPCRPHQCCPLLDDSTDAAENGLLAADYEPTDQPPAFANLFTE